MYARIKLEKKFFKAGPFTFHDLYEQITETTLTFPISSVQLSYAPYLKKGTPGVPGRAFFD